MGTSHLVRKAWEHLLTDAGLQYDFVSYDKVATRGVPEEYRVLILPACYALSDVEAERIREFCRRGGTVIADFACGLFDQHGKGRRRGALDDLFGVTHDGTETRGDFFGGKLWVETNQDAAFNYRRMAELLATSGARLERGFAVAEKRLPVDAARSAGQGRAVYLNLSPQRYLQYREEGTTREAQREVFLEAVCAAGCRPWVTVSSSGGRPRNAEVTYWSKGDRTLVLLVQKPATSGSSTGGGGADALVDQTLAVEIELPADVADAVDERSGARWAMGGSFPSPSARSRRRC